MLGSTDLVTYLQKKIRSSLEDLVTSIYAYERMMPN